MKSNPPAGLLVNGQRGGRPPAQTSLRLAATLTGAFSGLGQVPERPDDNFSYGLPRVGSALNFNLSRQAEDLCSTRRQALRSGVKSGLVNLSLHAGKPSVEHVHEIGKGVQGGGND